MPDAMASGSGSRMQLIDELRRRNVLRMAGVYLVAAGLVVQVDATLLPVVRSILARTGVELSITPSSAASSGFVFGAWFTDDPARASDDPASQRGFTLQADLSAANHGSVVVPIYSTLGGSFDGMPAKTTLRIGEATLTFDDCSSATLA